VGSRPAPGNSSTNSSKITRAKWNGGAAQGVQCFPCKCEALSSNPSPTKEKRDGGNHHGKLESSL
jgi:hypothetical protein